MRVEQIILFVFVTAWSAFGEVPRAKELFGIGQLAIAENAQSSSNGIIKEKTAIKLCPKCHSDTIAISKPHTVRN